MGKTLIIRFIFFFLVGYISFFADFSIGPRPEALHRLGAARALDDVLKVCGTISERAPLIGCIRNNVAKGIRMFGLHAIVVALEEKQGSAGVQDVARVYCHDITHALGQAGGAQSKKMATVLEQCTTVCDYGCYHGAAEGWMRQGYPLVSLLPSVCQSLAGPPQIQHDCAHGVGHAIPTATNYLLNPSLDLCDRMSEPLRVFCGSGVFMELFEPISFLNEPIPLPADHPFWCRNIRQPYNEICFTRSGTYEYHDSGSLDQAISVCLSTPSDFQHDCLIGLGKSALGSQLVEPDGRKTISAFCAKSAFGWQEQCVLEIFSE